MSGDYEIVKKIVPITKISEDGNRICDKYNEGCFIQNKDGVKVSYGYPCIFYLDDNHFAVCNVVSDVNYYVDGSPNERYYSIVGNEYEISNAIIKWGVIRVSRNIKGDIIPIGEYLVIPYMYDRISGNNLNTATAYSNGKLTYIDLDINSKNYGKQLVPCILDHAVPFSTQIEGFAECSLEETTGYLPRNCKPTESIEGSDLLNWKQAQMISKYLNGKIDDSILDFETKDAYFNLTGERIQKEKEPILVKKRK